MGIVIRPTEEKGLPLVQALWGDGDVMQFVGFPDGPVQSDDGMAGWYRRLLKNRGRCTHYAIFDGEAYCGETFYDIDRAHGHLASLDIKLFAAARGKGIAYKALHYAIEQAKLNGAKKVWVNPVPENEKAIRLYERLGFRRCEAPAHILEREGKGPYVYMEKQA